MYRLWNITREGAGMCDEYYDARMKAFWRVLAEADAEEELEIEQVEPIVTPIVVEPIELQKSKPKALLH